MTKELEQNLNAVLFDFRIGESDLKQTVKEIEQVFETYQPSAPTLKLRNEELEKALRELVEEWEQHHKVGDNITAYNNARELLKKYDI